MCDDAWEVVLELEGHDPALLHVPCGTTVGEVKAMAVARAPHVQPLMLPWESASDVYSALDYESDSTILVPHSRVYLQLRQRWVCRDLLRQAMDRAVVGDDVAMTSSHPLASSSTWPPPQQLLLDAVGDVVYGRPYQARSGGAPAIRGVEWIGTLIRARVYTSDVLQRVLWAVLFGMEAVDAGRGAGGGRHEILATLGLICDDPSVKINARCPLVGDYAPDDGTPLHLAVERGDLDLLALLLQHGGDPNVTDFEGRTPMHIAAAAGRVRVLEVLIAKRGLVASKDCHGRHPLHYSAIADAPACAAALLAAGASLHTVDHNGCTPLAYALQLGHAAVAVVLLPRSRMSVRAHEAVVGGPVSCSGRKRGRDGLVRDAGADTDGGSVSASTPPSRKRSRNHGAACAWVLDTRALKRRTTHRAELAAKAFTRPPPTPRPSASGEPATSVSLQRKRTADAAGLLLPMAKRMHMLCPT